MPRHMVDHAAFDVRDALGYEWCPDRFGCRDERDRSGFKQFVMPLGQVPDGCAYGLRVLDPTTYSRARIAGASFIDGHLPK